MWWNRALPSVWKPLLTADVCNSSGTDLGKPLQRIGPELNALQLSDDHGDTLRFTGAFVGVAAQDLRDQRFTADFTDFQFQPLAGQ
ncbi:hypothetical protein ACTAQJ_04280 [Arthrobacter sp. alpha11c]